MRKAGDRLRITLQLIDVRTQEHIWSEKYDRQLADVFAIQTEVAERTAAAIRVELTGPAREFLHRAPTDSLPAYELYLRAQKWSGQIGPESFRESVRLLEAAIERDPNFALAYAQLGHRLVQGAGDFLTHREGFARARANIERALALDPDLSEAHAARGDLLMQDVHDWDGARKEYELAMSLNPSNAGARALYSTLLRVLGRGAESEEQARIAVELNPGDWMSRWRLVEAALIRMDEAEAWARYRRLFPTDPNPAYAQISFALMYAELGRADEARRLLEQAGTPPNLMFRMARAVVYGRIGELDEARALLAELTAGPTAPFAPYEFIPALYALLGENERALELLEAGVRSGESGLWLRHSLPPFDGIRHDPRFVALLKSYHLPDEAISGAEVGRYPRRRPAGSS